MRVLTNQKTILQTPIFDVQELLFSDEGKPLSHPYYRLQCPDWVNVLPITVNNEAILIKQHRPGSLSTILETPGGVVDPEEGKDPTQTAFRELEEETAYTTQKMLFLGALNPNPALQNNRVHFFLALGCQIAEDRKHFPDLHENISVVKTKLEDLEEMVRLGQIDHSLSALCILLAAKYIKIRP